MSQNNGASNGEHVHSYHPATYEVDSGTPLGPFTCSSCGDIQITLPDSVILQAAPLAPPPPLPSTQAPSEPLPPDLAAIPEETRALALALYREHGVRVASAMTSLERETIRELAIFEISSYRAARKQLRREYLKEQLLRQATSLVEEIEDARGSKTKQELAAAAGTLIDRLRLESGDPSIIQETHVTEDPISALTRELEQMSERHTRNDT